MTGTPRKEPNRNDRVTGSEKPAPPDMADDDPVAWKHREAAARVFAPIRRIRRSSGKPTCIADVCRELLNEWWELCKGTWCEEEQEHREYDFIRSDPLTVAMFGKEWEEWPRHFATLRECIQIHCRGLEKLLLAQAGAGRRAEAMG